MPRGSGSARRLCWKQTQPRREGLPSGSHRGAPAAGDPRGQHGAGGGCIGRVLFRLTRPPRHGPAVTCPHAQRWAVVRKAGACPHVPVARVSASALAGAASRACHPPPPRPGETPTPLPNKETTRSLLLAQHLGLGALLTPRVPSSSWGVWRPKQLLSPRPWAAAMLQTPAAVGPSAGASAPSAARGARGGDAGRGQRSEHGAALCPGILAPHLEPQLAHPVLQDTELLMPGWWCRLGARCHAGLAGVTGVPRPATGRCWAQSPSAAALTLLPQLLLVLSSGRASSRTADPAPP